MGPVAAAAGRRRPASGPRHPSNLVPSTLQLGLVTAVTVPIRPFNWAPSAQQLGPVKPATGQCEPCYRALSPLQLDPVAHATGFHGRYNYPVMLHLGPVAQL